MKISNTQSSRAHWLLRIALASVFIYHGLLKLSNLEGFAQMLPIGYAQVLLVAMAEAGGGLLLLIGGFGNDRYSDLATRLGAALNIPVMIGAIWMVHWGQWNFVPNETHPMGGMQFQVVLALVMLYLVITGNQGAAPVGAARKSADKTVRTSVRGHTPAATALVLAMAFGGLGWMQTTEAAPLMLETSAQQTAHKTIDINGVEIFYREAGPANAPTILLLHGFPTSSHMFRNLIPALSDRFHLQREGNQAIQLALFYDYQSNVPHYPAWQEYLREYQPPTLIVWGKNDYIFPAEGAHPYKRDLKNLEFHLLDTGHFALEEDGPLIASLIRDFYTKRVASTNRIIASAG